MEKKSTNPNGANGNTKDPREQVCWDNYLNSIAKGQKNAYQSAIDAGYEKDTARNITMNEWFKERLGKLRRKTLLSKAEKVFEKTLDYNVEDDEGKIKTDLLRIQNDTSKFIASNLGREHYKTKTESELTGEVKIVKSNEELDTMAEQVEKKLKEKKLNEVQS